MSIFEQLNNNNYQLLEKLYNDNISDKEFETYLISYSKIFKNEFVQVIENLDSNEIRKSFVENGLFINNYKNEILLSDQERDIEYNGELNNYIENNKVQRPIINIGESTIQVFQDIVSGETYNFVMLENSNIVLSESNPMSMSITKHGKISFANHTIIARGKPVMSAGEIKFFKNNNRIIIFLSNKSGHYSTSYHSLKRVKTELQNALGIEEYSIYLLPFNFQDFLDSKKNYTEEIVFEMNIIKRVYSDRREYWLKNFNAKKVNEIIKKIINHQNLIKEEVLYLKEERRRAVYLRVALLILNENHLCDNNYYKYVRFLGKLNDLLMSNLDNLINIKNSKNYDLIISIAKKNVEIISDPNSIILSSIIRNYADLENVINYYSTTYNSLTEIVNKQVLTLKKFHKFRNFFKLYLALFQSCQPYYPESFVIKDTTEKLKKLVIDMGEINDDEFIYFCSNGIKRDIVILNNSMCKEIRELILSILPLIKFKY